TNGSIEFEIWFMCNTLMRFRQVGEKEKNALRRKKLMIVCFEMLLMIHLVFQPV
ncbi:hypothetical protein MKW92_016904, partial [Papaver armeniacum]